MMRRYWITLERQPTPTFLNLGIGVTAHSEADATAIFEQAFGPSIKIVDVTVIEDLRQLDQGHVVPNMGDWSRRGMWFPANWEPISN